MLMCSHIVGIKKLRIFIFTLARKINLVYPLIVRSRDIQLLPIHLRHLVSIMMLDGLQTFGRSVSKKRNDRYKRLEIVNIVDNCRYAVGHGFCL